MKQLILRVLFVSASAAAPAHASERSEAFARALDCRSLSEDAARLACFDAALAPFAPDAEKAGKDQTAELFGMVPDEPKEKKKSKSKDDLGFVAQTPEEFGAENVPELRAKAEEKRLKSIAFKATKITTNSRNVVTIYLENGQVWRQLSSDSSVFYPKKDKEYQIEIKRGALANYMASIDGFSRPLRVERIK
jgi:hypothetical protein